MYIGTAYVNSSMHTHIIHTHKCMTLDAYDKCTQIQTKGVQLPSEYLTCQVHFVLHSIFMVKWTRLSYPSN